MYNNIIHGILSTALRNEEALTLVVSKLREKQFTGEYRNVFLVLKHYSDSNLNIDDIVFEHACLQRNVTQEVINAIIQSPPCLSSLDAYIEQFILSVTKENIFKVQGKLQHIANNAKSTKEMLSDVEKAIDTDIFGESGSSEDKTRSIADALPDYLIQLEENSKIKDGVIGLRTHFSGVNSTMKGLVPKDLIILAGRPSMGKTAMAISLFLQSIKAGETGLIFSLEMPEEQIMNRTICAMGEIKQDNLRTGRLTSKEKASFQNCMDLIKNKIKLFINDQSGITISEIKRIAYHIHKKHGLKFLIIDYLQLMGTDDIDADTRAEAIGKITIALKGLAKDLKIPVLLLSQLNRSLEQRADKRPINSDLRESGSIEQDADVILFVYRDEVYNEKTKEKGVAELIIGKQRNGPLGVIRTSFQGEFARFMDIPVEI
tara:strand:+ start:637 stop:1929 length:1293 start_codon:yes stop_codon:yes gene_type:complete